MPTGYAIHIGLNRVSTEHYAGWDGRLNACENDARAMAAITKELGYKRIHLRLNEKATRRSFLLLLAHAARELQRDDMLVITYSGHGGVVPDLNGDEKSDKHGNAWDQTLCLYDGQLIDDELFQYWKKFREGVRIFMVADCCHSGTLTKDPDSTADDTEEDKAGYRAAPNEVLMRVNTLKGKFYENILKRITIDMMNESDVKASIHLFSACRDDQFARDGKKHGLFTKNFLNVWNRKSRSGYADFHESVKNDVERRIQEPQHFFLGRKQPRFDRQYPFQL